MCVRLRNDYLHYVNYPSDASVHVQARGICGIACFSTGPAAHVCRLMNSLSVCWDAVTRTLKCYLLGGLPTLQIKLFPSPQLQSKLRTCLCRGWIKADCGTKTCTRCHSFSLIKVCHFLLLTRSCLQPEAERSSRQEVAGVSLFGFFQLK